MQRQSAPMLEQLLEAAGELVVELRGRGDVTVTGLSLDSRTVAPGELFFCVPGTLVDGHRFAAAAVERGAGALVAERPLDLPIPQAIVRDARRASARIAAAFYGHPADELMLVGVTGTNGKTTTAFLLEAILAAAGRRTGLIGTIETRVGGEHRPGVRTTPDSPDLQKLFAEMRAADLDSVAMEVTSHALALDRVEGLRFAAAAFTNLSQDHLDFHASMEEYFEVKSSLFRPDRLARGAVNVDDPYGRRLIAGAAVPCLAFGVAAGADVRAEDVRMGAQGSSFHLVTPGGRCDVESPLVGAFNVSNCLAAAAAALAAGIELEPIRRGIGAMRSVPGRFERVDCGQPFSVIVDYAHTPASLENVLRAARDLARRRNGLVHCVFGCGGDRDRGKRPLMGSVVARLADRVVVTSDNPRSEDPEAIISQILEGVNAERERGADTVEVDRGNAIARTLAEARAGDVVLIAGKGHERGQEFADVTLPFDDRAVARSALTALGFGATPA